MTGITVDSEQSTASFAPPFIEWSLGQHLSVSPRAGFGDAEPSAGSVHGDRAELLALADDFTPDAHMRRVSDLAAPIVCSGHQPRLYHPGIQAKSFALREAAARFEGVAVDVIVDTDTAHFSFDCLDLSADPRRVSLSLLDDEHARMTFASAPRPTLAQLDRWSNAVREAASTLGLISSSESVDRYLSGAREVRDRSDSLGHFSVLARRLFEAPADLRPLVLPVSRILTSRAWSSFVSAIMADASEFAQHYNRALGVFRLKHATRSAAQPFPDLVLSETGIDLPFWFESAGRRATLCVQKTHRGINVRADGGLCVELGTDRELEEWVVSHSSSISPKAIMLTAFLRTRLCDLFIHGTGGYRYDEVCDTLVATYWGVEPAVRVSATADVVLPLQTSSFTPQDYSAALERANRARQHPEEYLDSANLSERDSLRAQDLAAEKDGLIATIAQPGADRKALGIRIKDISAELSDLCSEFLDTLMIEAESIRSHVDRSAILRDRSLSFPLFDPREVEAVVVRGSGSPV